MPLRALFPVNNIWCTENKLSVAWFDELLSDWSKRPCGSQDLVIDHKVKNEPRCEKTGLRGFQPGPTQTRLNNYRRRLEA